MQKKQTRAERETEKQAALEGLRELLPRGKKVYIKYIRGASSGYAKVFTYLIALRGEVFCIDWRIAQYFGTKRHLQDYQGSGIRVKSGDGTELIDVISLALYGDARAIEVEKSS